MKIPKIIHQVWEGRIDPHIPFRLQLLSKTWKEQNPDWEYHLWNGKEMEELVSNHFPEYKDLYDGFSYNVQRWDTIRYMILNKYGGVYTDLDSECFHPIEKLLENEVMCFGEEPPSHNIYPGLPFMAGNAFMASEKNCEGWMHILDEIPKAVKRTYDDQIVLNNGSDINIGTTNKIYS